MMVSIILIICILLYHCIISTKVQKNSGSSEPLFSTYILYYKFYALMKALYASTCLANASSVIVKAPPVTNEIISF